MELSDRRVVEFRQWAERRFAIGSGGYPDAEDLLSVIMRAVDEREARWLEWAYEFADLGHQPMFEDWLRKAMEDQP